MIDKFLSEKQEPSSEIKDGKIEYKFSCGISAYQEELTLEKDEKLAELLVSIGLKNTEEMKLADILKVLIREKLLNKFLGIILTSEDNNSKITDYSNLKNSELQAVVSDFFILNPTVKSLLQTLGSALSLKRMNRNTLDTEQNSGD